MDLIERAGRQLGFPARKSLVEKVAERIDAPEVVATTGPDAAELPRPEMPRQPEELSTSGKRQSRQFLEIDMERLRRLGFAPPGDQSIVAEEIRLIKRPLLTNA